MSFPTDVKVMLILVALYAVGWLAVSWFRRRNAIKWMRVLSERLDMVEWDDEMIAYMNSTGDGLWEAIQDDDGKEEL